VLPSEAGLVHERHYTDPSVALGDVGTKKADADSVYRIGSISQLLTVYLFLIRVGDQRFNDPITKYIPELAAAAAPNALPMERLRIGTRSLLDSLPVTWVGSLMTVGRTPKAARIHSDCGRWTVRHFVPLGEPTGQPRLAIYFRE
jgi:hypothetical protein